MRSSMIAVASTCFLAVLLSIVAPAAHATDDSVTVITRWYAAPGREGEVEARVLKFVEFVRKTEPNITYRAHRSKGEWGQA